MPLRPSHRHGLLIPPIMKITKPVSAVLLVALILIACEPPAPKAKAVAFRPAASIQDIMAGIVDPAADALWESVSAETTAKASKNTCRARMPNGLPCGAMP